MGFIKFNTRFPNNPLIYSHCVYWTISATFFSLVIDTILKQMELKGNITTRLKQFIAYADDILLTTRTKQSLLDTFQKLTEILAQYGLIVKGQKALYLRWMRKN